MQGHRMSVAWPSPKGASSDSISAGTGAIGYCQPNFKKHVMKIERFLMVLAKIFSDTEVCVCLTKPLKSQEYPADGSLIKYVFIAFTWDSKKL